MPGPEVEPTMQLHPPECALASTGDGPNLIQHYPAHTRVKSELTQARFLGRTPQPQGKITMYVDRPWSTCIRTGFLQLLSRQHAQIQTRNMTASSSRPEQRIECLIRRWKAEYVEQLSWQAVQQVSGSVDALRGMWSAHRL